MHVDLLKISGNYAVVRVSSRQFPGVVMQGDTLYTLFRNVSTISDALEVEQLSDLKMEIDDIKLQLEDILRVYEIVCADNQIGLPYFKGP